MPLLSSLFKKQVDGAAFVIHESVVVSSFRLLTAEFQVLVVQIRENPVSQLVYLNLSKGATNFDVLLVKLAKNYYKKNLCSEKLF